MQGAIIDPGGDLELLLGACKQLGVTLEQIWITHAHIDHAGGTADLAEHLKLPIVGPHVGDQFWIDGLAQAAANYGFPPSRAFTPTRWLQDGDTVTLGKHTMQVRHCPGHTPGHVVFYSPEIKRAFVGDVLFAGSIGRTDFPQGNHDDLINSITQRLWPMGEHIWSRAPQQPLRGWNLKRQRLSASFQKPTCRLCRARTAATPWASWPEFLECASYPRGGC
jgi:glyoxylase-like metal-dependent hydrolase (beta-lactamase superfamily II)